MNFEAFASEFLDNLEEMFPWNYELYRQTIQLKRVLL